MKKDRNNPLLPIATKRELAATLGIPYKILLYNLYKIRDEDKYQVFEIKKKNGGTRQIYAPISGIKFIQRQLAKILYTLSLEKQCAHGYVKGKSIKTNAQIHSKKRIVLNLDLANFFPSINFGRVQGIFKSHPFNLNDEVSTAIAQICCHQGVLPQGAPSSPIISNYICYRLDNQLSSWAKRNKVHYSRYADDLTFSTNLSELPTEIGKIENNLFSVSHKLIDIINSNGFKINQDKTRISFRCSRQEVTGVIVNSGLNVARHYVRHVRAMLHAWEKFELDKAAEEHFSKYNYKNKKVSNTAISFKNELIGKIGHIGNIKGKNNDIYIKLCNRVKKCDPKIKLSIIDEELPTTTLPIVYCEGKTDGLHLNAALDSFKSEGKFSSLELHFFKYKNEHSINNVELLKTCEKRSKIKNKTHIIHIFDRDDSKINKQVCALNRDYKSWGNNVFSALLPKPSHRAFEEICIEHYYTDADIKTEDCKGRRLYLSNEFDPESKRHTHNKELIHPNRNFLHSSYPRIIDSKVYKDNGDNVALTKQAFAYNIISKKEPFNKVSFEHFELIFKLLEKIITTKS